MTAALLEESHISSKRLFKDLQTIYIFNNPWKYSKIMSLSDAVMPSQHLRHNSILNNTSKSCRIAQDMK